MTQIRFIALLGATLWLSGCGTFRSQPIGEFKAPSDYGAKAELDERDSQIAALKAELEEYKARGNRDFSTIRDLEVAKCGHGQIEGGGSNYPVATFDRPEQVIERMDRNYLADNPGETVDRKEPATVKNINVGKVYPDVICLVYERGTKSCFDTMEITER